MRKLFALGIAAAVLTTSAPAFAVDASLPVNAATSFQVASTHGHKMSAKASKNIKKKKKVRHYRKHVRKHAKAKARKAG